jgi:hypothetical protein
LGTKWATNPSDDKEGQAMPTPEEVREWRALRGRFLNALWDAEHAGVDYANVSDLLRTAGAPDLPPHRVERLITNLSDDGLIDGITYAEGPAQQIRLTGQGRYEVEQWLAQPDRPTQHLQLPANQVFNIHSMKVTGTVMQGSTATNVSTTATSGASGDALQRVVAEFRRLIEATDLSDQDREDIDADLEIVEEEASSPHPRPQRVRAVLRRLQGAVIGGTLAGAEAGTKDEVIHLIDAAQRAITGG